MKLKFFLVAAGLALLFAEFASSASLSASAEKTVFSKGEDAVVLATIKNDAAAQSVFFVEANAIGGGLAPAPVRAIVSLAPGESKTVRLSVLLVDDGTPPGVYEARVRLLEKGETVSQATASFSVSGTLDSIKGFAVSVCGDAACAKRSSVYYVGESVFLVFSSATAGVTANAVVKTPGGIKTLVLPASLKIEDSMKGICEVNAVASKQGFKQAESRAEFAALEKPVTLVEEFKTGRSSVSSVGVGESQFGFDFGLILLAVSAAAASALLYWFFARGKHHRKKN